MFRAHARTRTRRRAWWCRRTAWPPPTRSSSTRCRTSTNAATCASSASTSTSSSPSPATAPIDLEAIAAGAERKRPTRSRSRRLAGRVDAMPEHAPGGSSGGDDGAAPAPERRDTPQQHGEDVATRYFGSGGAGANAPVPLRARRRAHRAACQVARDRRAHRRGRHPQLRPARRQLQHRERGGDRGSGVRARAGRQHPRRHAPRTTPGSSRRATSRRCCRASTTRSAKVSESLPLFDLWPWRYATSYEFVPGPECPAPLLRDDPGFRALLHARRRLPGGQPRPEGPDDAHLHGLRRGAWHPSCKVDGRCRYSGPGATLLVCRPSRHAYGTDRRHVDFAEFRTQRPRPRTFPEGDGGGQGSRQGPHRGRHRRCAPASCWKTRRRSTSPTSSSNACCAWTT